jgi:hypothetical protein
MIELPRRRFITGLIGLIAAPAIVRASSIMSIWPYVAPADPISMRPLLKYEAWDGTIDRVDVLFGYLDRIPPAWTVSVSA